MRRGVQFYRLLGIRQLLQCAGKMRYRVVGARHRCVAGGAFCGEDHAGQNFFRRLNLENLGTVLGFKDGAALIQGELGVDFRIRVRQDPLDAGGTDFVVLLRKQNHVAAELDIAALDFHQHRDFGGKQRFIVLGAPPINVSVAKLGTERIDSPLRTFHRYDIAVRHQQQRTPTA